MSLHRRAFSLIELLVVITIIAIILALLHPALMRAKKAAQLDLCAAHMHAISQAWGNYAIDTGKFVDPYPGIGWIGAGNSLAANSTGTLAPYLGGPNIVQCPSDTSGHFRTYSMNDHLGGQWGTSFPVRGRVGRPARTFVLLEENDPRGSNLGSWVIGTTNGNWVDFVTGFHSGSMNIAFVDAHVENWQWQDSRTLEIKSFYAYTPDNPDLRRLQEAFVGNRMPTGY